MAVYTNITLQEVCDFMDRYDLGRPTALTPIAEGIENSNYYVVIENRRYILTLFEKRTSAEDLPFFIDVMRHLSAHNIPCPQPMADREGNFLQHLHGKPALIVSCLAGRWRQDKSVDAAAAVATMLAKMHLAGVSFKGERKNAFGPQGWRRLVDLTVMRADSVAPALADFMRDEMAEMERNWPQDLPTGIIHADLFPDNVLFEDDKLSGFIDFYFASKDFFAYDVVITLNAWCFDAAGQCDTAKTKAMCAAYQVARPLSGAEKRAMPILARGAALRFLLTRLYDWLHPVPGAFVKAKDPLQYKKIIEFHRKNPEIYQ
jgi:homoserine kinase type II